MSFDQYKESQAEKESAAVRDSYEKMMKRYAAALGYGFRVDLHSRELPILIIYWMHTGWFSGQHDCDHVATIRLDAGTTYEQVLSAVPAMVTKYWLQANA